MLNIDFKNLDYQKENKILTKAINLDNELDLFILVNSKDSSFSELILNKIIDFSLDNISKENTYKDFSSILENINTILKTWRQDKTKPSEDLTVFI
jgi:hypothetical protein